MAANNTGKLPVKKPPQKPARVMNRIPASMSETANLVRCGLMLSRQPERDPDPERDDADDETNTQHCERNEQVAENADDFLGAIGDLIVGGVELVGRCHGSVLRSER